MFRLWILIAVIFISSESRLISVDFSAEMHPSFQAYDYGPYLVYFVESEISVSFQFTNEIKVFLNEVLLTPSGSSTLYDLHLDTGLNQLEVHSSSVSHLFMLFRGSKTEKEYSIWVEDEEYTAGRIVDTDLIIVECSELVLFSTFSVTQRHLYWQTIDSKQVGVPLDRGQNFLLMQLDSWAEIVQVERVTRNVDILGIEFVSPMENSHVWPRVAPSITTYEVLPPVDPSLVHFYGVRVFTSEVVLLTISSEKGLFHEKYVETNTNITQVELGVEGDTLQFTLEDPLSGEIEFYRLNLHAKSRNPQLQELRVTNHQLQIDIPLVEPFNSMRTLYHLLDLDYSETVALDFKAIPTSTLDKIAYQLNYDGYINSTDCVIPLQPRVGTNRLDIKVTAEDTNYIKIVSVVFYLKSNDATLANIAIPGDWVPAFDSSVFLYRVFVSNSSSIPIRFQQSHPNSTLSLTVNDMDTDLPDSIELTELTTDLTLTVYAETPSYSTVYEIVLIQADNCGNGLRYSTTEECDDGNLINGDGCNASCQVESGFQCNGGSSTSADTCIESQINKELAACGNGIVEGVEECDDGNTQAGDGCDSQCRTETNGSVCGDGIRSLGEECDDGNFLAGDGCFNCAVEQGWLCDASSLLIRVNPMPDSCVCILTQADSSDEEDNATYQIVADIATLTLILFFGVAIAFVSIRTNLAKNEAGIVVPGVLFCFLSLQLLHASHPFLSDEDSAYLLKSFGWSHLRFPSLGNWEEMAVSIYIPIVEYPLFICNQFYPLLIVVCTGLVSLIYTFIPKLNIGLRYLIPILEFEAILFAIPTINNAIKSFVSVDDPSLWLIFDLVLASIFIFGYIAGSLWVTLHLWKHPSPSSWWFSGISLSVNCSGQNEQRPSAPPIPNSSDNSEACEYSNEGSSRRDETVPDEDPTAPKLNLSLTLARTTRYIYIAEFLIASATIAFAHLELNIGVFVSSILILTGLALFISLAHPFQYILYNTSHSLVYAAFAMMLLFELLEQTTFITGLIIAQLSTIAVVLLIELSMAIRETMFAPQAPENTV